MRNRLLAAFALTGLLLLSGCSTDSAVPGQGVLTPPADPAQRVEWPVYGGDEGAQRYSPLEEITPDNVASLELAWEWTTGEREINDEQGNRIRPGSFEATPLMLADTLYLSTPYHHAVALDAVTGRELWRFDPGTTKVGAAGFGHPSFVHRGVAIWSAASERRVFLNSREHLFALDAGTGLPIPSFGTGGRVDLTRELRWAVNPSHYGQSSPAVVWRDLVVVGSAVPDRLIQDRPPTGEVQAFEVRTGRRVWQWNPIPRPGEPGGETWDPDASGRIGHTNVWAPFSVDTARGLLYLPVSTPTNDWYGDAGEAPDSTVSRWSASTRGPAGWCGTTRSCITDCGTTTLPPRRC